MRLDESLSDRDLSHGFEDRLTVIAARDDVIKTTLDFNSRLPGHCAPNLFFAPRCVKQNRKMVGVTPFYFRLSSRCSELKIELALPI